MPANTLAQSRNVSYVPSSSSNLLLQVQDQNSKV